LAYDADCGPCTRFRHLVALIDSRSEVEFVSLIDADESGLLDKVPEYERHTSFHLILPKGELLTGAEAVPRLLELLPGGKVVSEAITSVPGGRRLISMVYAGFARGHNGSACRYPRPVAAPRIGFSASTRTILLEERPSTSTYLFTGLIGGLVGSPAMGLAVHLPDALCINLATTFLGRSPLPHALAWAIHFLTAALIGSIFGIFAGFVRIPTEGCWAEPFSSGYQQASWSGWPSLPH
jgi:predicted DCC family thiol-disulfide oxidoreductase YuxK